MSRPAHYLLKKFMSYDSSDRLYIYAQIYYFAYVRKFTNSVTHVRICVRKSYAQKLVHELLWTARLVWICYESPWSISAPDVNEGFLTVWTQYW